MPEISRVREKVKGKKAAIYMGGPAKALTLIKGFDELGMEVVIIGTRPGKKRITSRSVIRSGMGRLLLTMQTPLNLPNCSLDRKLT